MHLRLSHLNHFTYTQPLALDQVSAHIIIIHLVL